MRFEEGVSCFIHLARIRPIQKLEVLLKKFIKLQKAQEGLLGDLQHTLEVLFKLFNLLDPDLVIDEQQHLQQVINSDKLLPVLDDLPFVDVMADKILDIPAE